MAQLKIATGTDEIADIAVVMDDSDEMSQIERDLRQHGFNVHCFRDDKEYGIAAQGVEFDATLVQGVTSTEVGRAMALYYQHPGKYCLVNGRHGVIDNLGIETMVGYCLEPGYSREDLVGTVRQMISD